MKRLILLLSYYLISMQLFADIAPNPIVVKGIYTIDNCKIQMTREYVYANLYNDSARIECTFELLNKGDNISIQIGFPEMNFQYWSIGEYNPDDKTKFEIFVDGKLLTENEIGVPNELDSIYKVYMYIYFIEKECNRKADSIYKANNVKITKNGVYEYLSNQTYQATKQALDDLYEWRQSKPYLDSELWDSFNKQKSKGNFPWYLWNVAFNKGEQKTIKVVYSLPSGMGYGANYRYFKYILETGSGWYDVINSAVIKLKLHNINIEAIEEITPSGSSIDYENKTIVWNMQNLEPTDKDDIYVKYYNPTERRKWEKYKKKRKRAHSFRIFNPINWFR